MADVCKIDPSLLERYLDGELAQTEAMKIQQHLQECSACRARVEVLRLNAELLQEHLERAVQEADFSGFEQRVMENLAQSPSPGLGSRILMWLHESLAQHRAAWVGLAAAAAAILLIALLGPWSTQNSPATQAHSNNSVTQGMDSIKTAQVDNDVIIDQMEYQGKKSMIFTVSKNNTTVIWMYDFDRTGSKSTEGDEI